MCDCDTCQYARKVKAWVETLPEGQRDMAEELYEQMCGAQSEAEYYKAIVDGVWPSSVAILRRSLLKAKAVEADRAAQ